METKQWRRIRRTGCILFDTWDESLSPGSNIEMRQQYVAASIRRSCRGDERQTHVNPGNPTACLQERIGMHHVWRRTCRSVRMLLLTLQWQSMISTSPKYLSSLSVQGDDTHAGGRQLHSEGADITDPSAITPLSNNVNIDGANLSGFHRSQVGTCAHPAQSGQLERMIQKDSSALELMVYSWEKASWQRI